MSSNPDDNISRDSRRPLWLGIIALILVTVVLVIIFALPPRAPVAPPTPAAISTATAAP
jgi:hypothetical protein